MSDRTDSSVAVDELLPDDEEAQRLVEQLAAGTLDADGRARLASSVFYELERLALHERELRQMLAMLSGVSAERCEVLVERAEEDDLEEMGETLAGSADWSEG